MSNFDTFFGAKFKASLDDLQDMAGDMHERLHEMNHAFSHAKVLLHALLFLACAMLVEKVQKVLFKFLQTVPFALYKQYLSSRYNTNNCWYITYHLYYVGARGEREEVGYEGREDNDDYKVEDDHHCQEE